MLPAAVLAVVVKTQGVTPTNAKLQSVHSNLVKTNAAAATAAASMATTGKRLQKTGASMAATGSMLTKRVALPLVAIGVVAGKMSLDFEQAMTMVHTQAGASAGEVKKLRGEVLKLAKSSEFSPVEMADGLFRVESAGFRGAEAIDTLKASVDLAAVGQSDLEKTTAAVTAAMKSGIRETESAARTAGILNAAVGQGSMRMEDLVGALSTGILPSAKSFGLTLRDVTAAIDLMTKTGVPANSAATRLRMTFSLMAAPTSQAAKALKSIGLEQTDMAKAMRGPRGLDTAITLLKSKLDKFSKVKQQKIISEAFGGGRTSSAVIALIENVDTLGEVYDVTGSKADDFGKLVKKQSETDLAKLKTAWSSVQVAMVEVGDTLRPAIVPSLITIMEAVGDVSKVFAALPEDVRTVIIAAVALGVALGPILWAVGNLTKGIGLLIALGGKIVAFFAVTTTATTAQTTANAKLAASHAAVGAAAQASAKAQSAAAVEAKAAQLSMAMPGPVKGGQMSLLATPASAAAASAPAPPVANTTVASAAGKTGAARIAAGLARALPFAFAAAGVANIASSAVQGDMEKAGFKSGGALVGGIAGALLGKNPAAAAIGAGLGSFVGGMVGDIFSDAGEEGARRFEESVQRASQRVQASMQGSKTAFETAAGAQRQLGKIGEKQERVTARIERAEERLAQARKNHKAGAPQVSQAEAQLSRLKNRDIRLTRRQWSQEQLLGGARNRGKQHLRNLRESEVGMIRAKQLGVEASQRQLRKARETLETNTRQGASLKTLTEDEERLKRKRQKANAAVQTRTEWEKRLGTTMKEISDRFGPKYADHLRETIPLWTRTKEQIKAGERAMRRLTPAVTPLTEIIRQFGRKSEKSTKDTKQGFEKVKGALGPFRSESNKQLGKAQNDIKDWRKVSVKGIGTVQEKLGAFGAQLGFKNVAFGVSPKGKGNKVPGKQKGGMVVPGSGTGDKVRLTADVEPGEVVHVLNKRAAPDLKKLGALEALNRQKPRHGGGFQKGGSFNVDGAKPGFVPFMNFLNSMYGPIYVMSGARPGSITTSGNMSNHATGNAVDISTTQGGLNTATSAASLNATGAAAKRMDALVSYGRKYINLPGDDLWRTFTGGNHFNHWHRGITSAHASNPALMMAYLSKLPEGAMFGGVPGMDFTGPDGVLTDMGQAVLDSAVTMANKWLDRQMMSPSFGTGKLSHGHGKGKLVGASTYAPDAYTGTVGAAGKSLIGTNAFAELGMGQNLGGLPFGAKMRITDPKGGRSVIGEKLDIGAGGGSVQGHRRDIDLWHETASALGLPGQPHPGWLGVLEVEKMMKGGTLGGSEYLGALAKGGTKGKGKKKPVPISKSVKNVLKGIAQGKHLPKYRSLSRKLGRRIEGIGLSNGTMSWMADKTGMVEQYAEYASNASSLTTSVENPKTEEEEIIQGVFKGRNEGGWLEQQLSALLSLRDKVVGSRGTILDKKIPQIKKLIDQARKRLKKVKAAMRQADKKKLALEKKIKEIDVAKKKGEHQVQKEVKDLERKLQQAGNAKKPNKDYMGQLRAEIQSRKGTLSDNNKKSNEEVQLANKQIRKIDRQQQSRGRVKQELEGTLIPAFIGRREGMYETARQLHGSGPSFGEKSIMGLEQIQGAGGMLGDIGNPPALGSVGGEIFNVQNRMKTIKEEMARVPVEKTPETEDDSRLEELLALQQEISTEYKQKYAVSQAHFKTLQNFPSVQQVATAPYAGEFALGGSVVAKVGERGAEMAVMPTGSYVVNKSEAREAVAAGGRGQGSPSLSIDELNIYEDTGRITGLFEGKEFELNVKRVNRKEGRGPSTPGGRY